MGLWTLTLSAGNVAPVANHDGRYMNTEKFREGDVIVRKGRGIISDLFCRTSVTSPVFSHAGILLKQDKTWYVCHSIGGESDTKGGVRIDPLSVFCHPEYADTVAVFSLCENSRERSRVRYLCLDLLESGIPFDREFDYSDDTALYCTELVSKVLSIATLNRISLPLTHWAGWTYVSCENLYRNDYAHPIPF